MHPIDFNIPADIAAYLAELDAFIEREIRPLEQQDDNTRFFDHRREHARTDYKGLGLHNDLQNESPIVGNFPVALLLHRFGTEEQKDRYIEGMFKGTERIGPGPGRHRGGGRRLSRGARAGAPPRTSESRRRETGRRRPETLGECGPGGVAPRCAGEAP
jgi:hypothetical protein